MLTQHDVEHQADARLPQRLADMDIRDLIKPESIQTPNIEGTSPSSNRMQAKPSNSLITSSISSPPLSAPKQVLPPPSDLAKYSQGNMVGAPSQTAYYIPPGQNPVPAHQHLQSPAYEQVQPQQQRSSWSSGYMPNKRPSPTNDIRSGPPPKRQSKWNPEEDRKIIAYRGQGMKWSEISARLYPRTEIGCRLHYQNYLEKRSDWDEEKKNKLARVYERVKEDMWKLVANEMKIPWRSAEGMHWIMGETEMARRANVTPFSNTIQSSSTSSTATAVYSNANANVNDLKRVPNHRDANNTIVFNSEQLATLNAPLGTNVTNGPVSTFVVGGSGVKREPVAGVSIKKAPRLGYAVQGDRGHDGQQCPQEGGEDPLTLSPDSNRAMRDISPHTYQAMREKGVLLPSVSEMECMVPITGSASSSLIGGGQRNDSENGSVSGRSSNGSASGRARAE